MDATANVPSLQEAQPAEPQVAPVDSEEEATSTSECAHLAAHTHAVCQGSHVFDVLHALAAYSAAVLLCMRYNCGQPKVP